MDRLVSPSLAELLEKLGPSISSGSVNLFSVDEIRARSVERWARKRPQVVDFIERAFSKLAQPSDVISPLNDTEFVTIQPNSSQEAALSLSASVLKETLQFFLGAGAGEDLRLFRVTSFEDGELRLQPVTTRRKVSQAPADDHAPRVKPSAGPPLAGLARLTQPHQIDLPLDPAGSLRLVLVAEPVWNAAAQAIVSYALQPTASLPLAPAGPAAARPVEISPALAADIAVAVIDRAAQLLASASPRMALHLPIALRALTYSTARYQVLHALQKLPVALRKLLVMELIDIPKGLPAGQLTEAVSTLAPYARAVLGRVAADPGQAAAWGGCGLKGVSLDCADLLTGDREALVKLTRFVESAQAVGRPCVAYGLGSRSLLMTAWAAGCTHLSGPAVAVRELPTPGPVRFQPRDLFAAELRDLGPMLATGPNR